MNDRGIHTTRGGSSSIECKILLGEVHVWLIPLDTPGESEPVAYHMLSADEMARADRFRFERDRKRFTMARAAMRAILARYVGTDPRRVAFDCGEHGKPELVTVPNASELKFNFSHSSGLALLGVTRRVPLGIDIEAVRGDFAAEEIAHSFFSADEVRRLLELPEGQRTEAFFCCWTMKEAYVKALGQGLAIPLDSFSVAFQLNNPAALLRAETDANGVNRWTFYDIRVHPAYKAALVVEGKDHEIHQFEWTGF